jgi:hypothetical protein
LLWVWESLWGCVRFGNTDYIVCGSTLDIARQSASDGKHWFSFLNWETQLACRRLVYFGLFLLSRRLVIQKL